MNKGPNATICLVRRQNHAGTTVSWTTVKREKSSHAYKLSSNVQTACSTDSLNNCPKHSILRFSSFALKIYLWLKMCQHNLPCSIVYAHCLLPGRAFASLYVLLFLEKEAEIGGRVMQTGLFSQVVVWVVRHKINDPFNIKAAMLDIPEPSMLYWKCTLAQARLSLCRMLYIPKYCEITCADPGPDPHTEKSQKYRVF